MTATPTPAKEAPNVEELLDASLSQEPTPSVSWRDAVLEGDDVPENFRGKKAGDLFTSWQNAQTAVRNYQSEKDRALAELQNAKTQLTAQQAAQQAVREMLRKEETPKEDPRYEQLNELWFSDPKSAQEILSQIHREEADRLATSKVAQMQQQIRQELDNQRNQDMGRWAYEEAYRSLRASGVPEEMFNRNRIAALYSAITLPSTAEAPNPYFDNGGPRNPGVIRQAWQDLFGLPQTQASPGVAQIQPPPIATPPGGGRPAAATVPVQKESAPMRKELQDLYGSIAEEFGRDKEKLIERHRRKGAA